MKAFREYKSASYWTGSKKAKKINIAEICQTIAFVFVCGIMVLNFN